MSNFEQILNQTFAIQMIENALDVLLSESDYKYDCRKTNENQHISCNSQNSKNGAPYVFNG